MLKLYCYCFIVFITIVSCGRDSSYQLKVTTDFDDGKSVYLIEINDNYQPETIDTTIIENGEFQFQKKILYPQNSFVQIEDYPHYFLFIAENGNITMDIKQESLPNFDLGGTLSNDGLNTYKKDIEAFRSSLDAIGNEGYQAQNQGDSILVEDLYQQYYAVEDQILQYDIDFIKNNPFSFLSLMILQSHIQNQTIPIDSLIGLYDNLSDKIKRGPMNRFISESLGIDKEDLKLGDIAPDFRAPRPNGEIVSLREMKSKVTLLDFWASWCKPCRIHSPDLVDLYNTYKSKGFNIISISLDENRNQWLQAIEDDGLGMWNHISHLKSFSEPVAIAYNVDAIPQYFLLDSVGKIQKIAHDFKSIKNEVENLMAFQKQSSSTVNETF